MKPLRSLYEGKRVLITGAAGTIGKALIDALLALDPLEIRAIDNNESALFFLNETHGKRSNFNAFFSDIRDLARLQHLCRDVDIILHVAALKHVIISEMSPLDAVRTNAEGTSNVIQAALASDKVSHVIYTSSDKAVNPTNVMGTTKLLGERLMTSALNLRGGRDITFSSTRFGNVIGSKGSVVPIFYRQIREGGPVTVTDERMTRFIMTIPAAASLVLEASCHARGGEVFVTKMPVMRIEDVARAMIAELAPHFGHNPDDIEVTYIGAKPGEKLYEELMTLEETPRALELEDLFVVRPAIPPVYDVIDYDAYENVTSDNVTNPYVSSSEAPMSVDEIRAFFVEHGVLDSVEF